MEKLELIAHPAGNVLAIAVTEHLDKLLARSRRLALVKMNENDEIVVICHHGARSMQVAMFLERKGFASLFNLTGGVDAWAGEFDPKFRRY